MVLSVEGLTFQFGTKKIFENVSLHLTEPGIYGLVAPNGHGKTTFLNLLANFYRPTQGSIQLMGRTLTENLVFEKLYFSQDSQTLYDYLTAEQHLKFVAQIHQVPLERLKDVVTYLEMTDYFKEKVGSYSLGMRQRTLLALALLVDAPILLLDEPLNGLDPSSTILIREALKNLANSGKTVLVSSHNLDEMDKITDKILFIKDQKIWLETIAEHYQSLVRLKVALEDVTRLQQALKAADFRYQNKKTEFVIQGGPEVEVAVLNLLIHQRLFVEDFVSEALGAEERYRELYRGGESHATFQI